MQLNKIVKGSNEIDPTLRAVIGLSVNSIKQLTALLDSNNIPVGIAVDRINLEVTLINAALSGKSVASINTDDIYAPKQPETTPAGTLAHEGQNR